MAAVSRAGWVGGVVLLVCCAAAAVLWATPPDVGPVSHPYELTQQDEGLLDNHHANAVKSCTSVRAKWRDGLSGCQWYLSDSRPEVFDINVEPAWEATLGEGVTVLVVDDPVDYRHEDLRDNMDPADSPGLTEAAVTGSYTSHGTAMASIIAARDNAVGFRGVAPRAALTWRVISSADIGRSFGLPQCVEVISADGSVAGSWAPDCESSPRAPAPARYYTFSLDTPSRVTIDLRSSLDSYLFVRDGFTLSGTSMAVNDDGGSGSNARVSRTFPAGVYTIEATTYARQSRSGSFILQIAGLDGASVPERRWAPVWDSLLEAAVVNRSYGTASYTQPWMDRGSPYRDHRHPRFSDHEIYDTMAEFGFGGRGTLNVVSGGKTFPVPGLVQWSTLAEDRSHPAVVAVCATDRWGGRDARYNTSFEGPNLWVCAPVGGIVQAALGDRYYLSKGTPSSPATALVSGVAALVRSLDSNLSWRDVKLILAASAQHNDPGDAGWQQGAAVYGAPQQNYRYHHSYGFGVVDAGAAVQLAQNWRYLPEYRSEHISAPPLSSALAVADDGSTVTADLAVDPEIDFVEYVEAHLVLDAPWFRDLEVELESPSGIVSTLSVPVGDVTDPAWAKYDCKQASECGISGRFRFGTSAHLGEDPAGTWTLRLADRRPNGGANALESWSLRFFGHKSSDPTPNLTPSPTFEPWPQVSITAGLDIDEGDNATFTITADPAPAAPLDVTVTVTQTGDYGVTTGARTVTIGMSGTGTLSVATVGDAFDEGDGSVTATLRAAGGPYRVSAEAGTASVAVSDGYESEVSITAGTDITEGGNAIFTVTADPAPAAAQRVEVVVTPSGDFGVARWNHSVVVPVSGTATLTVSTVDDSVDEPDGSVTAAIGNTDNSWYSISQSAGSATVAVSDDDSGAVRAGDPCVAALSGDGSVSGQWIAGCRSSTRAGRFARFYGFSLDEPSQVRIDLVSSADTFMYLRRGVGQKSGGRVATDDDGGDGYDSRISRLLAAGDYTIEATTYDPSTAGSFILTVDGIGTQTVVRPDPVVEPDPVVSVEPGSGVTEGGDATFTVTADPAPTASLTVNVAVSQSGDFGVSPGSRTVTVPATGTVSLTVATADDSVDEADGSVTATVSVGTGYTASATAGSASVAVADDDDPAPPLVCVPSLPSDAVTVSVVTGWRGEFAHAAHRQRWDRVLAALGVDTGEAAMTVADAQAVRAQFDNARWDRTVRTLEAMAQCDSDPPPAADPEVSVAAGGGVAEGGDAAFTVTAVPAPSAALTVEVTVSQSGDFGAATGSRTVTVPTTGSVTLTVATTDDSTDEADGSVTVTVNGGTGYTVSSTAGTATVAVADDDDPAPPPPPPVIPQVGIAAGGGVTEGGDAAFTVSAVPAPAAALTVEVTIAQTGDFGAGAGSRQVTIPTTGSATFTVATVNDSTDEADGTVTATVGSGSGYTVSSTAGAASVAVADDDDPAPPPPPVVNAVPSLSISDASAGEGGTLTFTVTLSPASGRYVWVNYYARPAYGAGLSATYADFAQAYGMLTFRPGETAKTVTVAAVDDSRPEGDETFVVVLYSEVQAAVIDREGIGTITDDD